MDLIFPKEKYFNYLNKNIQIYQKNQLFKKLTKFHVKKFDNN